MSAGRVDPASCFELPSDVRYRLVDGEVVIVVQGRGEVLGLNATASSAFDLAARGRRLSEITDELLEELDVERATLEADLQALFVGFTEDGLLLVRA